ncbi:MAG: hypothetical protein AB7K71_12155 [Polyangiaceae bacterium]
MKRPGYAHCELASALLHGLLGRGRAVPWAQLTHLPEVTRDLELARILEDAIVHGRVVRR